MIKDFKAFVMRGNVLDMAVGIIIGAAFGKIIASLVKDVIMPPIGLALGGVDFSNMFINLTDQSYATLADAKEAGAAVIAYGAWLNTVIEFLIIAFVIFLIVRAVANMQKKEEAKPTPPPAPPAQEVLLTEIRDLLKKA